MHYFLIFYLIYHILSSSAGSTGTGGRTYGQMQIRPRHGWLLGVNLGYLGIGWLAAERLASILGQDVFSSLRFASGVAFLVLANGVPRWLAWQVCGPRGWRRAGRACLAVSTVGQRPIDQQGVLALFSAAFDPAIPDLRLQAVTPWTAAALVVVAERRGDVEHAAELALGLERMPAQAIPSQRWRGICVEILALGAARRGDWREVERRIELGSGRRVRLLRLLARAHAGEPSSPLILRCTWALAPGRRESREWLGAALAALRAGKNTAPVDSVDSLGAGGEGEPWSRHLRLLAAAAASRSVSVAAVAALAQSWGEVFATRHEAAWLARGLVLGTRAPAEVVARLRDAVLEEMDALLDSAEGEWPLEPPAPFLAELLERRRDRLLAGLERWTAAFPTTGGITRPLRPPLEEWADWTALRRHVQRLAACGGTAALETAWHTGLRLTACNWPFYLHKAHEQAAAWPAYVMHTWSSWIASWTRDPEIRGLSHSNAQILYRKTEE